MTPPPNAFGLSMSFSPSLSASWHGHGLCQLCGRQAFLYLVQSERIRESLLEVPTLCACDLCRVEQRHLIRFYETKP